MTKPQPAATRRLAKTQVAVAFFTTLPKASTLTKKDKVATNERNRRASGGAAKKARELADLPFSCSPTQPGWREYHFFSQTNKNTYPDVDVQGQKGRCGGKFVVDSS